MKRVSTLAIILLFIITACTTQEKIVKVRAKYSGDHTTAQIRGMWHICYQSRMRSAPHLPPPFHMDHCDCVIDKSREEYSSKYYKGADKDNLTRFFTEASIACDQRSTQAMPEPTSI